MTAFDRLKILCDKRGISINDLEERIGIGKNTLYSWKKSIPTGANLIKVADYFDVSTDYLLGRTDWAEFDRKIGEEGLAQLRREVEEAERYDRSELIAAHIDEDVTEEEMEDIIRYINFLKSKHDM